MIILIGTLLLMTPAASSQAAPCPPADALFTATSAVCVTGLVVRDTWQAWSGFGQAVILLLIQTGGMGVMLMICAVDVPCFATYPSAFASSAEESKELCATRTFSASRRASPLRTVFVEEAEV